MSIAAAVAQLDVKHFGDDVPETWTRLALRITPDLASSIFNLFYEDVGGRMVQILDLDGERGWSDGTQTSSELGWCLVNKLLEGDHPA